MTRAVIVLADLLAATTAPAVQLGAGPHEHEAAVIVVVVVAHY